MDERKQFTFYRSFWEAVKTLPKKDRLPVLEAIISYALDGVVPQGLTQGQSAFFLLVKPNLDSARKKAASGKQGGSKPQANSKQTESKPKQTASKKEGEKEEEKEKEIEIEGEEEKEKKQQESAPHSGKPFTAFWEAYPSKIDRESAWEAWKELNPDPQTAAAILSALDSWKQSSQWADDGGRFVPNAAKFLSKGYWHSPPKPSADGTLKPRQLDEDERAAIAKMMAQEDT